MINNFKKLISSLFITATLVMIFSACQKTDENQIIETQTIQEVNESLKGNYFAAPIGYEEEELMVYLQNVTTETSEKLIQNYVVAEFLLQEDLFWDVKSSMKKGDHFADIDLSQILDANQLEAFKNFVPNDADSNKKGCYTNWWECYTRCCYSHPLHGSYCTYSNYC